MLEAPLIVHNRMEFMNLQQRFDSLNFMVVYCDPAKHGANTYNQVISALSQVRKEKPLNFMPPKKGSEQ